MNSEATNKDDEEILLCMAMLDSSILDNLFAKVREEHFDYGMSRDIYRAIKTLHASKIVPNLVEVSRKLRTEGKNVAAELAEITSRTYTSANFDHYAARVVDYAVRRSTAQVLDKYLRRIKTPTETGVQIAGELESEISNINASSCGSEYKRASYFIDTTIEQLEWNIRTGGQIRGVESHFSGLKEITGFRNGEYIIIAARPSIGKTALALNIVEDIAIRRAIPCGMLSLEMSAKQLQIRLLASMTRLNSWAIAGGLYKDKATMDRMHVALSEIGQAPMFIDETSSLKLSDMKAKVRRMVKVDGCKIIMVDYISLIDAEQPRIPRHEQIAEISRSTKALAKELDIPIIMLSQLTRDSEGKTPTLASLAETRSLEQDADVIMFLHRPRAGTEENGERPTVIPTDLIVAKNRNGPIGTAKLIFIPNITKFRDATEKQPEEII